MGFLGDILYGFKSVSEDYEDTKKGSVSFLNERLKALPSVMQYSTKVALHLNPYPDIPKEAYQKFLYKIMLTAATCDTDNTLHVYTSRGKTDIHERQIEEYPVHKLLSGCSKQFTPIETVARDYTSDFTVLNVYLISYKDFTGNAEVQKLIHSTDTNTFSVFFVYFLKSEAEALNAITMNLVSGDSYDIQILDNFDHLSSSFLYGRLLKKFSEKMKLKYARGFS